jgi:phosphoenolpyruvate-protein kinase (PTS system EI component)
MRHIRAKSIFPGRIRGIAAEFRRERFVADDRQDVNPRSEYRTFKSALRSAQLQLAGEKKMMLDRRKRNPGEIFAIDDAIDVLESHLMTLEDPYFLGEIKNRIFNTSATAAAALGAVITMISRQFSFEAAPSRFDGKPQNRHFLKDMSDMKRRIQFFLGLQQEMKLPEGVTIVAAPKLTVSEVLALKRAGARGIIIGETSDTAHELVMLRAMRIPCVSVSDARFFRLKKPVSLLLDADIGYIVLNPKRSARFVESVPDDGAQKWSITAKLGAGVNVQFSGTLHFMNELQRAPVAKQRIGLYRTEYQVSEAREMPSLRALQKQYEHVMRDFPQLDVTYRLFDFSDDKNFLNSPAIDANRELRGIRFLLHEPKVLANQLGALMRAARETQSQVNILLPFVSERYEITAVKTQIAELTAGKRPVKLRLGAMLENAAGVLAANRWVNEVDFFYVGTSDLLSSLASERRENAGALHRALVGDAFAALAKTLKALATRRPLTICGEVAGEPWALAYLVSLGFRDFTVPTHRMPIVANMVQALGGTGHADFARKILAITDESKRVEFARSLALEILYGKS